jgi:thioredoxin 1
MQKPLELTDNNFKEVVLDSELPVLIDFWASWCPPCKMMEPALSELAGELGAIIRVAKLNVDQNPKAAAQSEIQGVPTLIIFKDGRGVLKRVGAQSKKQIYDLLAESGLL